MKRSLSSSIFGHQRADRRIIARHDVVSADEDEAVVARRRSACRARPAGCDPRSSCSARCGRRTGSSRTRRRGSSRAPGRSAGCGDPRGVDGDREARRSARSPAPRAPAGCTRSRRARDRRGRRASRARARPSAASRKSAGSYGAKYAAGVTLWYCSTRPARQRRERRGHRRRQRVVEDRQVAAASPPRSPNGRTSPRSSSSIVSA